MGNISASDLGEAIVRAVKDYTEDVEDAIKDEIDDTAKAVQQELRATSPEDKGDYKKGWRIKRADTSTSTRRIIHNATDYQLVHLLEKGHAKRGGGRVAAKPHVGPAVDRHIPKMERNIERIVKGGGR